jgi:hypothetical protein
LTKLFKQLQEKSYERVREVVDVLSERSENMYVTLMLRISKAWEEN